MPEQLFIGLMSGTSVDGIDATLVAIESKNKLRVIATQFTEFTPELRDSINHTAQNNTSLRHNQDSPLHADLAPVYAKACVALANKAKLDLSSIRAIANHGQTVKHEPLASPPYSLQLGDGQIIANLTGVKTISQFRQADLALGGQGAPLMPAFHAAIFGNEANKYVLNIGGIANLTRLGAPVIGFDTGPGNVLLDQWINAIKGLRFDQDGNWASSGKVNTELLSALLADDYFATSYPKSTGTDYFNLAWLTRHYPSLNELGPEDVQATLLQLTVDSVVKQLAELSNEHNCHDAPDVYVCGGGANNGALMTALKHALTSANFHKTDTLGVPSDWVEAAGFAWLGFCCENGFNSNLPSVTGASAETVLGQVFLPQ